MRLGQCAPGGSVCLGNDRSRSHGWGDGNQSYGWGDVRAGQDEASNGNTSTVVSCGEEVDRDTVVSYPRYHREVGEEGEKNDTAGTDDSIRELGGSSDEEGFS